MGRPIGFHIVVGVMKKLTQRFQSLRRNGRSDVATMCKWEKMMLGSRAYRIKI